MPFHKGLGDAEEKRHAYVAGLCDFWRCLFAAGLDAISERLLRGDERLVTGKTVTRGDFTMRSWYAVGIVLVLAALAPCCAAPVKPKPVAVGSRIAVFVGVDRFEDDAIKRDLNGCANDAVELQEVLRKKFRFAPAAVLTNAEATKGAIKKALAKARDKARSGDQVLFFFSGFGSLGVVNGVEKPTLCPYDALRDSAGQDVWLGDLYTWACEVRSKRAAPIIIFDCCFAEPVLKAMGPRIRPRCLVRTEASGRQAIGQVDKALTNVALAGGGAVLLTACEPDELAREWDRSVDDWMGVFTYNMIQELNGLSYDDDLSFLRLQARLNSRISRFVADRFYGDSYTQTPALYGITEYLSQAGLNSKAAAVTVAQAKSVLRLLIKLRGFGTEEAEELKRDLGRLPHVELVDSEERADLQLDVYRDEKGELDAYLLDYTDTELSQKDSSGNVVVPAKFTAAPADHSAFLTGLNTRVRTLVAYQWLGSLGVNDPSLGLELEVTDESGKQVNTVSARGQVCVKLRAAEDCYVTLYGVTPRGQYVRILPEDRNRDSQQLSAGQTWSDKLTVSSPERWRLVAIGRRDPDQRSDRILRHLWAASLKERYGVAPELIALGRDGSAQGDTGTTASGEPCILPLAPADLLGLSAMGDEPEDEEDAEEMLQHIATDVADLAVAEASSE